MWKKYKVRHFKPHTYTQWQTKMLRAHQSLLRRYIFPKPKYVKKNCEDHDDGNRQNLISLICLYIFVPLNDKLNLRYRLLIAESADNYSDVIMDANGRESPDSPLFTQIFIQAQIKKHQRSASMAFVRRLHRLLWFPRKRASNAENVSILIMMRSN